MLTNHWIEKISPVSRGPGEGVHPPYWVEPSRVLYEHQLVLVREGVMEFELEEEMYTFSKDSFFIVPSGVHHVSREISGLPLKRAWVHFDWLWVHGPHCWPVMVYYPNPVDKKFIKKAPDYVPKKFLHGTIRKPAEVWDVFKRYMSLYYAGGVHEQMKARASLLELFVILLDEQESRPIQGRSAETLTLAVRSLLDEVAAQPQGTYASLSDVFTPLDCSYEHACRVFKSQYGVTPVAYVNNTRLERAKRLLRDTGMSSSDIAYEVGYPNVSYFNRLFKRMEGQSPLDYRRVLMQ